MDSRVLGKFGSSLIAVFTFNLISKVITFGGNIITVRLSDPMLLGEAFQYEVWLNTLLFLSREPLRNATQRFLIRTTADTQNIMNCGALSCIMYVLLLVLSWVTGLQQRLPDTTTVTATYALGGMLELLAEPYTLLAITLMSFRTKVKVESFALFVRMSSTVVMLVLSPYAGGIVFAMAQVLYGLTIMLCFLYFGVVDTRSTGDPEWESHANAVSYVKPSHGIPRPMLITAIHMIGESFLRLVLTEGEKVVLLAYAAVPDMGVYRVVSHLASIVCRLVFKFLEDVSFTAWSKLLSTTPQHTTAALHMLKTLCRAVNVFGLLIVALGVPYSHTALMILFGTRWADDPNGVPVLRGYCVYIMLLGMNGLFEAFFRAAASERWLRHAQMVMVACSCAYVGLCIVLMSVLGYGVVGLIAASCVSMLLRIGYVAYFLYHYIPTASQRSQFLHGSVLLSPVLVGTAIAGALVSSFVLDVSHVGRLAHVGAGVLNALVLLAAVWRFERPLLTDVKRILTNRAE